MCSEFSFPLTYSSPLISSDLLNEAKTSVSNGGLKPTGTICNHWLLLFREAFDLFEGREDRANGIFTGRNIVFFVSKSF